MEVQMYDNDITINVEYRGFEFPVTIHYDYDSPTGFTDDPYGGQTDIGYITRPTTLKPLSQRLTRALLKEYKQSFTESILDKEENL
tara:strand:- start:98 stop:355 length:258 start_codon:yes stop_codon:yes gene_type:complete